MTRNLHNFTKGAELNEGGLDTLRAMFERQRVEGDKLVDKLRELRERQADLVADSRNLQMVPVPDALPDLPAIDEVDRRATNRPQVVVLPRNEEPEWYGALGPLALNAHAHRQIAEGTGIPQKYYREMLVERPDLLAINVNTWWEEQAKRHMVRVERTAGEVQLAVGRAYLSDRYARMDYLEVAEAIMPVFTDPAAGWIVLAAAITDQRLHIEVKYPTLSADVRVGDPVALGVKITTSEVGVGALTASVGLHRAKCSNLLVVPEWSHRQVHLGGTADELVELLSERTMRLDERVRILKMRDVVRAMANPEQFGKLVAATQEAAAAELRDPAAASELLASNLRLTTGEKAAVQGEMMRAGDPTVWGLVNALTSTARNIDYERKADLEAAAGRLVTEPRSWREYREAAA